MDESSDWGSADDNDDVQLDLPVYIELDPMDSKLRHYPDFKYKVYRPDELLIHMNEIVEEVYDILGLSKSVVRMLLLHYKWDKEKLIERYFESDTTQLLCDANITPASSDFTDTENCLLSSSSSTICADAVYCGICFLCFPMDGTSSLRCRHEFCNTCWDSYLNTQILTEGRSDTIQCPAQSCNVQVDENLVRKLIKDKMVLARYQKLVGRSFVENSKLFRWCPGPSCLNAIGVLYTAALPVKCTCGVISCFQCGHNWHEPIQCKLLSLWLTKCDDDSESANWLAANTKDCPGCHFPIEKRGGCNHMTCTNSYCRFEFCWICLGPWKPHGVDWYQCNRFDESAAKHAKTAMEKSRSALLRYLHYYNRYINHMNSLKLENKLHRAVRLKMESLQNNGMSWIEVQFLRSAVDILLQCRQTLMYTYGFAFYLSKNNQCDVFEQNQADLERATEDLSYYLENEFGDVDIVVLKQKIQDKYRYCKNRRRVLINHVYEGYDRDYWDYRTEMIK
ncbi:hypothetical protein GJ496_011485 [Pomphorhynchus laevis]|nr:hypothetical protein GJ496_011485 [Pomphorhynchus laevis]